MRYLLRFASVPVIAFALLSAVPSLASAQSSEGLKISPAIVEDKAEPGQAYHFSLSVTNLSATDQTYYLGAVDIAGLDTNGNPMLSETQEHTGYELSSWVKFPESSVDLSSGQSKTVSFTIQVPSDATPGSHFGSVYFDRRPPKLQTTGSAVGFRVGNVISLRIAGNIAEDVQLHEFSTEKLVYSIPDVMFNTKIANNGNLLERPHGFIEISDMWGKKVGNIAVNDTGAPVFPGGDRVYKSQWKTDSFAMGRYQALESIVYGEDGRRTITATTSFWVLPLKLIAIVLGSILGVVLLVYALVRTYIRRKLREMGVSGSRGDMNFYAQRYQKSGSRLLFVVGVLLLIALLLLVTLFVTFA